MVSIGDADLRKSLLISNIGAAVGLRLGNAALQADSKLAKNSFRKLPQSTLLLRYLSGFVD